MLVVTGVSCSGKSTLVHDTLYAGIKKHIGTYNQKVGKFRDLYGISAVHNVEMVDQSPIGRSTSRTLQPIPKLLMVFEMFLLLLVKLKLWVIPQVIFPLMCLGAVVKPAKVRVFKK